MREARLWLQHLVKALVPASLADLWGSFHAEGAIGLPHNPALPDVIMHNRIAYGEHFVHRRHEFRVGVEALKV